MDAIVILGDALLPDGTLSGFARLRVERGLELLRGGAAPVAILSGKGPGRGPGLALPVEAVAMRDYALSQGAPAASLLVEDESDSTLQNAYFTKVRILEPRGFRRLVLVTSAWHLERALLTFGRILGEAYLLEPAAAPDGPMTPAERTRRQELERYFVGELQAQLAWMAAPDHARIEALIAERRSRSSR